MQLLFVLLFIIPSLAIAQGVSPLSGNETFVTEFTRKVVSLGWGEKKSWSDYSTLEIKWSRESGNSELFTNPVTGNSVFVDTNTFHNYQIKGGDRKHGETIQLVSTRNNQALSSGVVWKAEHTYKTYPATWCYEDKSTIDSKFEVGPIEPYVMTVFGKEVTLDVVSVLETGWWNRCYSGRRYTRYLVSKELGAIVSIEYIGYTPQGQAHESSYRMSVREIKKP